MVFYLFECKECDELQFSVEGSMKKPPKRRRCPICNQMCDRVFTVPGIKFIGDFYTNRAKAEKFNRDGMDKVQAHEFLESSIKHSKERMQDGWKVYKAVQPKMDKMVESGTARKVDPDKAVKKKELHKQLTIESHKKAGRDPAKPKHPQGI